MYSEFPYQKLVRWLDDQGHLHREDGPALVAAEDSFLFYGMNYLHWIDSYVVEPPFGIWYQFENYIAIF
jgi:hypothetical protein